MSFSINNTIVFPVLINDNGTFSNSEFYSLTVYGSNPSSAFTIKGLQGDVAGYASSGDTRSIERWPFATDSSAQNFGTIEAFPLAGGVIDTAWFRAGNSSGVRGYDSGGFSGYQTERSRIDKFSFSTNETSTTQGNLTQTKLMGAGVSSFEHGYVAGGIDGFFSTSYNVIERFPFSADANASDAGDLSRLVANASGHASPDEGFVYGSNIIDRFPFATGAIGVATVFDSAAVAGGGSGQSSSTHGYSSGTGPIVKFSLATKSTSSTIGNLTQTRDHKAGASSLSHGYNAGGNTPAGFYTTVNTIDKFPFATDGNATDVGDLISTKKTTGHQY